MLGVIDTDGVIETVGVTLILGVKVILTEGVNVTLGVIEGVIEMLGLTDGDTLLTGANRSTLPVPLLFDSVMFPAPVLF